MKFEVNIPVRKNLLKQKENKMENNETINANEMVKNGKTAVRDYISNYPEVILVGAAVAFYIGYQTGKSHQLNELLRASMGVQ
jgi:hypothetical protein